MPPRLAFALALALASAGAASQTVSLGGSLGGNALLVIDGKPRNVAVGSTVQGVRLISVTASDAVVEVGGKRVSLQLGAAQVNLGGVQSEGSGKQIVITSESGGHFITGGSINGKAVRFMVDTGATSVAMSQAEAERIGVDFKNGQRGFTQTANGAVPAFRTTLAAVRIGDVMVYNVDAIVIPAPMPYVLLGNSYLTRFQMRRENDRMTLDKRY
ncbi:MAG TPA: TIGR02281 family clan AA aspartic protease [Caldimonas sp.]|nr:TIGR02281 family clan AA aspartic protease [Caldimonas sp.]HEX2541921.1 TIGR02281 family clan AA aspartic protease [Caldimonas sp.]